MSSYVYKTSGTCSRSITVELDGKIIRSVSFEGGCPGNLLAIGKLVEGADAKTIVSVLRGNDCAKRGTSCADQLAIAVEAALQENA